MNLKRNIGKICLMLVSAGIYLLGGGSEAMAQEACLTSVLKAYKEYQKLGVAENIVLDFRVVSYFQQNGELHTEANQIQLNRKGRKSYIKSRDVELYQDEAVQVAIFEGQKMVMVVNATKSQHTQVQMQGFLQVRDSLLALSKVKTCQMVTEKGVRYQQTVLALNPSVSDATEIETLEIWLNTVDYTIKKIKISYKSSYELDAVEIDIIKMEVNPPKQQIFAGSALSKVFTGEGKLLSSYQHFTLKDLRK